MPSLIDLTDQVFGRLTVVGRAENKNGKPAWRCQCACGSLEVAVRGSSLRNGDRGTKSCGCLIHDILLDRNTTHGLSNTKGFNALKNAVRRCTNPMDARWRHYGGRGIAVCKRWMDDPQNFIDDMGEPREGLTLERLDVNGDYEPSNCTWVTNAEQQKNRRDTIKIAFRGESHCLKDWSRKFGIPYNTLHKRFLKGRTPENMLFAPVGSRQVG